MQNATGWALVFLLAVGVHNLEEALWLPAWTQNSGRFRKPVGNLSFLFAVGAISLIFAVCGLLAIFSSPGSVAWVIFAAIALAMAANAILPHLAVSVITHSYMPGTATGLLLVLPVSLLLVRMLLETGHVDADRLMVAAPGVILVLVACLPVLQVIGNRLFGIR